MRIKRFIPAALLGGVAGVLLSVFVVSPVAAISVSDYFSYSYNFAFSKTSITGSEAFMVTVIGNANCVHDLPMTVSAANIVSTVIGRNQQTGAEVVLNPNYSLRYDNSFPNHTGQTASVTVQVPLSFPGKLWGSSIIPRRALVGAEAVGFSSQQQRQLRQLPLLHPPLRQLWSLHQLPRRHPRLR